MKVRVEIEINCEDYNDLTETVISRIFSNYKKKKPNRKNRESERIMDGVFTKID